MRIGILSDTHGLLRDEVMKALEGVDHIIHDRDIREPLFDYLEETYGNKDNRRENDGEIPRRYQRNYFKETIR